MPRIVDPNITCYSCSSLNFNWYSVCTGVNGNEKLDSLFPYCHNCHDEDDEVFYCSRGKLDPDNHAYFLNIDYILEVELSVS